MIQPNKTLVKLTAMRNIRFKIENIFNGINENNLMLINLYQSILVSMFKEETLMFKDTLKPCFW